MAFPFHPGPWWSKRLGERTVVHDIHGRQIAEVLRDIDRPDRDAATVRLIQHAPTVYITLWMACGLLREAGEHRDLVHHIEKVLDLVDPAERARRLKALAALPIELPPMPAPVEAAV